MKIRWDEKKRQLVLKKRNIDFSWLSDLLTSPYVEDQGVTFIEQYRIIGTTKNKLLTYIVEYRKDQLDEYMWVVTAWKATKQEKTIYEKETKPN